MINKLFILSLSIGTLHAVNFSNKEYVDNLRDYPSILSMDNFTQRLNSNTNPIQQVIINFSEPTAWDFVDYRDQTTTTYTTSVIVLDNTNRNIDMKILGESRDPLFTINRSTAYYTLFDLSRASSYNGTVRYSANAKAFREVDYSLHQVSYGQYVNVEHIATYANAYNSIFYDEFFNQGTAGKKTLINGYLKNEYDYFNDISITYINALGTRYYDGSTSKVIDQDNLTYPFNITYGALFTGVNRQVAHSNYVRRVVASEGSQEQYLYSGGLTWSDLHDTTIFIYTFNINFRSTLSQLEHTNGLQNLLWSPNELNTSGGSFGGSSSVLNNTFALLRNAFDSLSGILSIQIFPSISLGLILFMPLIGGLIVILVKVFKK